FIESAYDATGLWGLYAKKTFEELSVVLYSGTGMLNTLLSRTGQRLGLLITKGFEDAVIMGRGMQTWAGYCYEDRLLAVTHAHPKQLLQINRFRGISVRID